MKNLSRNKTDAKPSIVQRGDSSSGKIHKVSIQGFEGSFHQEAARKFFGKKAAVICCATFREVVKIAENIK